jgi:hypothetical protein
LGVGLTALVFEKEEQMVQARREADAQVPGRVGGSSIKTSILRKGEEKDNMLGLSLQREQNTGVHPLRGV